MNKVFIGEQSELANLLPGAFIPPNGRLFMPFRPGQRVPESGAYWVRHYQHRLPQRIHLEQGDAFPHCRKCGERVSFEKAETNNKTVLEDHDLAA